MLKHFDVEFVKVKIWNRSQTKKIDDKLHVQVIKKGYILKYVPLEEFCKMNNLDYDTFCKVSKEELANMYLKNRELGGANIIYINYKEQSWMDCIWSFFKCK